MTINCCYHKRKHKSCLRRHGKSGKFFALPRKFTKAQCKNPRGFTMKTSCAPYKFCVSHKKRIKKRMTKKKRGKKRKQLNKYHNST